MRTLVARCYSSLLCVALLLAEVIKANITPFVCKQSSNAQPQLRSSVPRSSMDLALPPPPGVRVLHAALRVSDLSRSVEFYRRAFGLVPLRVVRHTSATPDGATATVFLGFDGERYAMALALCGPESVLAATNLDAAGNAGLETAVDAIGGSDPRRQAGSLNSNTAQRAAGGCGNRRGCGFSHIALGMPSIRRICAHLRRLGVALETDSVDGTSVIVNDPDGNTIRIFNEDREVERAEVAYEANAREVAVAAIAEVPALDLGWMMARE